MDALKRWCSVAGKRVCFKYHHKLVFHFIILLYMHAAGAEEGRCKAMVIPDLQSVVKQGEIMLAGFFRFHSSKPSSVSTFKKLPKQPDCFNFNSRIFRWLMAMIFAIVEVNNDPLLLPNVTLGYMIYEACFNTHKAVKATVSFIGSEIAQTQENICKPRAIIGSARYPLFSIGNGILLSLFQVSYTSTCKCLSDKKEYPSFLRTVPSDAFQATAMARIVSHFHWVFLGALQDDDDYGKQGIAQFDRSCTNNHRLAIIVQAFMGLFASSDCDVPFRRTPIIINEEKSFSLTAGEIIERTKVSVIVVFSAERRFSPFVKALWKRNITGKIWIASETWATFQPYTSQRLAHIFQGTIGFALRHGSIPGFYDFLVNLSLREEKTRSLRAPGSSVAALDPGVVVDRPMPHLLAALLTPTRSLAQALGRKKCLIGAGQTPTRTPHTRLPKHWEG
uniref:Receptor ligand binding region domain-containing protein n=1 Tax=Eptatretus burgeri TaxID=7764 RepID=A0A8C4R177_EPTBU